MRSGQLAAVANVTDPDSRFLYARNGSAEGCNIQVRTCFTRVLMKPRDRVQAVIFAYEAGLNRPAVGAKHHRRATPPASNPASWASTNRRANPGRRPLGRKSLSLLRQVMQRGTPGYGFGVVSGSGFTRT